MPEAILSKKIGDIDTYFLYTICSKHSHKDVGHKQTKTKGFLQALGFLSRFLLSGFLMQILE
jgi:hypothetical protein